MYPKIKGLRYVQCRFDAGTWIGATNQGQRADPADTVWPPSEAEL